MGMKSLLIAVIPGPTFLPCLVPLVPRLLTFWILVFFSCSRKSTTPRASTQAATSLTTITTSPGLDVSVIQSDQSVHNNFSNRSIRNSSDFASNCTSDFDVPAEALAATPAHRNNSSSSISSIESICSRHKKTAGDTALKADGTRSSSNSKQPEEPAPSSQ
jgi:hypothetical protein